MDNIKLLCPKPGVELLAVKVPEGAHSFDIQVNSVEGGDHIGMLLGKPDYAYVFTSNLPDGNWKILGLSAQLSEEVCRELVPDAEIISEVDHGAYIIDEEYGYIDYTDEEHSFETAKESFASFLQANEVTEQVLILRSL